MIHAFKDEYGFLCEYPVDWDEGYETKWCLKRATHVGVGGKHYCEEHAENDLRELELLSKYFGEEAGGSNNGIEASEKT